MIPRLFLGLFIVFLASVGGASGQTCPNIPTNPTNESGEPSVIRTESPTCTAPDVPSGAYIKVQTQGQDPDAYKVHFRATSSGSCQIRYYSCYPCQCYNGAFQLRTLGTSTVRRNGTIIGYVYASGTPYVSPTSYDTSVPTGTTVTGWTWKPTTEGKYTFTSTVQANVTNCNLTPASFDGTPYTVNVVKCKPDWLTDTNNHIARVDTSGTITINVPAAVAGLFSPTSAAAADWETKTGFDISVVNDTPCSGNRCITIEQPIGGSCGNTPGGETDGSGVRTGASTIEVSALWPLWPSDGQQRTIAHELGHLLGLEDYDSSHCGVSDAAMQDTFDCSSSPVMKDVTVNDQLPVNSTSYGGGTRTICGF